MSTMEIEFPVPARALTVNDIVNQQEAVAPQPTRSIAAPPPPQLKRAAAPTAVFNAPSSSTDGVDYSFLDALSNKRKTKNNKNKASNFMEDHDDVDMYGENKALAEAARKEQMDRMRKLRREAEIEVAQSRPMAPVQIYSAAAAATAAKKSKSAKTAKSSGGSGRNIDADLFAEIMGGKKGSRRIPADYESESSSSSAQKYHASRRRAAASGRGVGGVSRDPFGNHYDDDDDSQYSYDDDDMAPPPKTAAELYLEERQHKAKRVARIQQLESKGIMCSLPDDIEWMSLPLSQIDDAAMLMETMYKRKGKILKMRAGFFGLNKALVYGATNHPGPEFLKFYKVRGFDKTVAKEIDEFDDDLEKLYDLWFGEGGDMHPLLSILLIEATMLGNHVMSQSGDDAEVGIKTEVAAAGTTSKGNGAASQTNLLTNMMSMLSNNPAMSGAVQSVMGAAAATPAGQQQQQAQQAQQQQAQQPQGNGPYSQSQSQIGAAPTLQNIFAVRDYGAPPETTAAAAATGDRYKYDPATAREFHLRDQQIRQLEEKLRQETIKKDAATAASTPAAVKAAIRTLPDEDTEELRLLMDNLVSKHVDGKDAAAPPQSSSSRPASLTVEMPASRGRGGRGRGRGGRGG